LNINVSRLNKAAKDIFGKYACSKLEFIFSNLLVFLQSKVKCDLT